MSSSAGPSETATKSSSSTVRMTARPTLVRIVRPPSEGDIVEFRPSHNDTNSGDHGQPSTSSTTVQFIVNNNNNSNSRNQPTISKQSSSAARFHCSHCKFTDEVEEQLLEHICAVHLEPPGQNHKKPGDDFNIKKISKLKVVPANKRGQQKMMISKPAILAKSKKAASALDNSSNEIPAIPYENTLNVNSQTQVKESTFADHSTAHYHYVCQFLKCSKRFAKLDQLRQHHRGHLNLKPYQCNWTGCLQDFSRRPAALRHVRTAHFKLPRERLSELTAEERAQAHQYVGVVSELVAEEENALDAVRRAKKRIFISGETLETSNKTSSSTSNSKHPKSAPNKTLYELEEENSQEEGDEDEDEEEDNLEGEEPLNPTKSSTKNQLQQNKSPRRYACQFPRCDQVYHRLYSLRMHHRSHTKMQPYYCKFPVVPVATSKDQETSESSEQVECGETFRRRANAARHVLARHYGVPKAAQPALSDAEKSRAKPFIGERAVVLAREEASLESLRVNKPRDPSRPPLKYRCQHKGCGKFFPAPGKLLIHQRTHSEALKPFYCRWEGCPKRAVTERATLLRHILREHFNSTATSSSTSAFSEEEKASAAPYVGVHQHLIEQERRTVLTREEEVIPSSREDTEKDTEEKKRKKAINFQSLFSVPMSSPFPPVHFGPVYAVQIAVHQFD